MHSHKLRDIPEIVLDALSGTHPLIYLLLYLLAIPVFATVYCVLPSGIYAPYAHLENGGRDDIKEVQIMLAQAIQRQLRSSGSQKRDVPDRWNLESEFIAGVFDLDSSKISFDLYVMAHDRTNAAPGLMQFPVRITIPFFSRMISYADTNHPRYFRVPVFERAPNWSKYLDSPIDSVIPQLESDLRVIELKREEEMALERLFRGAAGDATAVSGVYGRMFYFSAMVQTTVGFGDIVPMTMLMRLLVALQAMLGIAFVGLFLNAVAFRAARRVVPRVDVTDT
ncbi:MAG TPA: potassium channel family protein [Rhizomicrobium sp.]